MAERRFKLLFAYRQNYYVVYWIHLLLQDSYHNIT